MGALGVFWAAAQAGIIVLRAQPITAGTRGSLLAAAREAAPVPLE